MKLGIVSSNEFDEALDKLTNHLRETPLSDTLEDGSIPQAQIKDITPKGRGNAPEVPDAIRGMLAESALTDGSKDRLNLYRTFWVSQIVLYQRTRRARHLLRPITPRHLHSLTT